MSILWRTTAIFVIWFVHDRRRVFSVENSEFCNPIKSKLKRNRNQNQQQRKILTTLKIPRHQITQLKHIFVYLWNCCRWFIIFINIVYVSVNRRLKIPWISIAFKKYSQRTKEIVVYYLLENFIFIFFVL